MTDSVEEWIKELRKRNHEHGNHISRIEGQMLADRMVNDERHRATESQNRDIKNDLGALSSTVTHTATAVGEVSQDLRLVLQRMDSDEKTREATATALALAEQTRRDRATEHWVTPNRVIGAVLAVLAILAYVNNMY